MKKRIHTAIMLFVLMWIPRQIVGSPGEATIIFSNYDLDNTIFMNRLMVQRIFTRRETRWSNGDSIIVFIKPMDSIEHRNFVSNTLNMTLYRYQQSLETYTYTARALPVTEVANDQQMLTAINTHPGAIGYVNYQLVMNNKTITICEDIGRC